jgi:hypothetical protein
MLLLVVILAALHCSGLLRNVIEFAARSTMGFKRSRLPRLAGLQAIVCSRQLRKCDPNVAVTVSARLGCGGWRKRLVSVLRDLVANMPGRFFALRGVCLAMRDRASGIGATTRIDAATRIGAVAVRWRAMLLGDPWRCACAAGTARIRLATVPESGPGAGPAMAAPAMSLVQQNSINWGGWFASCRD